MFFTSRIFVFVMLTAFALGSFAATDEEGSQLQPLQSAEQDRLVVTGVRQRLTESGLLNDVIAKTEVVTEEDFRRNHALNLSDAVAESPGVRVSVECSLCAVKRIGLNGLRGEHTTILVDGLPLYTMLAGFYAVDGLITTGVQRIEVARGAGASLLTPESLGGAINIVSRHPEENGLDLNASYQSYGGYSVSAFGTAVTDDGSTRASVAVQANYSPLVDLDRNNISEQPNSDTESFVFRLLQDFGPANNLELRLALTDHVVSGGETSVGSKRELLEGFDGEESPQLFLGNDVRQPFIGKPWESSEWIQTKRRELSGSWIYEFGWRFNSKIAFASSRHEQDSIYSGFDYRADNRLKFGRLENNFLLTDDHLLTFGIDLRSETLRSNSDAGRVSPNYIEDSFDYKTLGLFVQDTWTPSERVEVSLAMRFDQLEADFIAAQKPGKEIDQNIFSPRLDALFRHGEDMKWASRFSIGRGYRAPLSFFESDHGLLDAGDGFAVDIRDLEKSISTSYSIAYESGRLSFLSSVTYTKVNNLASIEETDDGRPLLTQIEKQASVLAADLVIDYRVTDFWSMGLTIDRFHYDAQFKQSFNIAPIERRVRLTADYHAGDWKLFGAFSWIGGRDLEPYGYLGFNVLGETTPKPTDAPSYALFDIRLARQIGHRYEFYVGVNNMFDKTQVGDMDTPLFWDLNGDYDVGYIYGPLRGREFYAGLEMHF